MIFIKFFSSSSIFLFRPLGMTGLRFVLEISMLHSFHNSNNTNNTKTETKMLTKRKEHDVHQQSQSKPNVGKVRVAFPRHVQLLHYNVRKKFYVFFFLLLLLLLHILYFLNMFVLIVVVQLNRRCQHRYCHVLDQQPKNRKTEKEDQAKKNGIYWAKEKLVSLYIFHILSKKRSEKKNKPEPNDTNFENDPTFFSFSNHRFNSTTAVIAFNEANHIHYHYNTRHIITTWRTEQNCIRVRERLRTNKITQQTILLKLFFLISYFNFLLNLQNKMRRNGMVLLFLIKTKYNFANRMKCDGQYSIVILFLMYIFSLNLSLHRHTQKNVICKTHFVIKPSISHTENI